MSKILAAIFVLLISIPFVYGQSLSGVTGVVTDSTGAIVPGVAVKLTDTKTTQEQTATTNDQGVYKFSNIQPGAAFTLTFTSKGFQTLVISQVALGGGVIETHDAQLVTGQVTEVVTVTSTTGEATLNTSDGTVGNIIGTRELKELPIQLRGSPAALLGLQPGVVGSNLGTTSTNRVGSVTGSRADQTNITVDGIDVNDQATGQAFSTVGNAPIDSIQEFRGTVAGLGADAGRGSGGQIQLFTNSGTNQFHGSLREYYRNEHTAANAFFNNANRIARPALRRHQYGGSLGGPLPYPNFGENDGPRFKSGKDKVFFFFDDENRRDRSQTANARTVPLQTFRNGQLGYLRATNAQTGAACTTLSRTNDPATAGCIGYLSTAQIAALDPQHIGVDTALLNLYNSRFPLPNDLTGGDGINTGLFRFNSPNVRDDHIYTIRFDVKPTDHQSLFFRTTITRRASTNSLQFLPQDADAVELADHSYGYVIGHTWVITPSLTNVATAGVDKSELFFTPPTVPTFPYTFAGGTIGAAFASPSYQDRLVTTPTLRDDITWTHGSHTIFGGVSWKPIRQLSHLTNDFNFVNIGLGTSLSALNTALRPADILNNSTARSRYDTAFTTLLGNIAQNATNYNYDTTGTALPAGSGKVRNYAYNEYETYIQDNWKIRSDLTLNLGVRYVLYPAPYETNGLLASDTTDWRTLLATRVANAAAGISGDTAEPLLTYTLAGKTNNAPPLYQTDKNNWAPRIGFAYSPSPKGGILGKFFGDRKTSLRGSYALTYDRVSGAVLFIQNQSDYLFANSATTLFGNTNPVTALLTGPRFNGVNTVPAAAINTPPVITNPFTPFVSGGSPFGEAEGDFNFDIDHNFKTPYSHLFDFSYQRELPGNHLLTVSYVGRFGRSLFVQSDVAQVLNFKDNASGQFLFPAFNQLQSEVAAGGTPAAIPFFESQILAAARVNYGVSSCTQFGFANCTALAAAQIPSYITVGDTSDAIATLNSIGLLNNNVGLSGQFASNAYITNQGSSSYHGMLVSLQKRFSKGYQYDINYTLSKSLDNNSTVANTVTGGLVCDVLNPDVCRGPSDFDIRHILTSDFIAQVPIGRGRWIGGDMNRFVNALIGGWSVSGVVSARSGLPFSPSPSGTNGSFPLGFEFASPEIVLDASALQGSIHQTAQGIQYFADTTAANNALRDPHFGEIGTRNTLRGPSFWDLDMGLYKKVSAPWSERQTFEFRADAFNLTNSNFFALPNVTKGSSSFGLITGSSNTPREVQFAIRWDF